MKAGLLTDLSDAELRLWLAEVRTVARQDDTAALAGVDVLLWSVRQWWEGRDVLKEGLA